MTSKYKVILSIIFSVLFVLTANQTVKAQATFDDIASDSWILPTTWTVLSGSDADGIPDSDDTVLINSNTVTLDANKSINITTVSTGGTLNANGKTLAVSGTLTVDGGNISATAAAITITAGAVSHTSGIISTTTSGAIAINAAAAGTGTFSLGQITSAGTLGIGNTTSPASVTLNGALSSSGACTVYSYGDLNVKASVTRTSTSGSTVLRADANNSGGGNFVQDTGTTISTNAVLQSITLSSGSSQTLGTGNVQIGGTVSTVGAVNIYGAGGTITSTNSASSISSSNMTLYAKNGIGEDNDDADTYLNVAVSTAITAICTQQSGTGNIYLNRTGGNLNLSAITADTTSASVNLKTTTSGSIASGTITGATINFNSAGNIGSAASPILFGTHTTINATASSGEVHLKRSSGNLTVNNLTAGGNVTLTIPIGAGGNIITTNNITATGGNIAIDAYGLFIPSAGTISTVTSGDITLSINGSSTIQNITSAGALTLAKSTAVGATATYTVGAYSIDVAGTLTIDPTVSFISNNTTAINVAINWVNNGTFTPGTSSTVTLDGTDQTLTGSTTFYNFSKTDPNNDSTDLTLTFDRTATQTINGLLTLDGLDDNDRINLVSDGPGTQWHIIANGAFAIDYVDVTDSDASGGTTIPAGPTSIEPGDNNNNWTFKIISVILRNETDTGDYTTWAIGSGKALDTVYLMDTDVTDSCILVKNNGNVAEDFSIEGVGVNWTLGNVTAENQCVIMALFNGNSAPIEGNFSTINDIVNGVARWATVSGGGGNYEGANDGDNVAASSAEKLYFYLKTPSSVTSGSQETVTVTIGCQEHP